MANGSLPYLAFEQLMGPKIDKSATDAERKEITRRAWEKKSTKFKKHFWDHISEKVGGKVTQVSVIFSDCKQGKKQQKPTATVVFRGESGQPYVPKGFPTRSPKLRTQRSKRHGSKPLPRNMPRAKRTGVLNGSLMKKLQN